MGLLERADSLRIHTKGLFRKSLELLEQGQREPPRSPVRSPSEQIAVAPATAAAPRDSAARIAQIAQQALAAAHRFRQDVEYPCHLFASCVNALAIGKAAMLLYDWRRRIFAPWASIGYDETTLHRMRISLDIAEGFGGFTSGKPAIITEAEPRAAFQRYFSSRESALLSRLVFVPFLLGGQLVGVMLITEMEPPGLSMESALSVLTVVAEQCSPFIAQARENKLRPPGVRSTVAEADPREELQRSMREAKAKQTSLLLVRVSVSALIQQIHGKHSFLDPFRIREDTAFLLTTFLRDTGGAVPLGQDSFALYVDGIPREAAPIVLHQLKQFLSECFADFPGDGTIPFDEKVMEYPADGNAFEGLFSGTP